MPTPLLKLCPYLARNLLNLETSRLSNVPRPLPRPPAEEESRSVAVTKALIYGCINAVVCAPVMISFASIIFRHPTFHRDAATYARLVKLVLFSSAVHQAVFVTTSSLVFAVGQVQDAGLIFLSKMATNIAASAKIPEGLLDPTSPDQQTPKTGDGDVGGAEHARTTLQLHRRTLASPTTWTRRCLCLASRP